MLLYSGGTPICPFPVGSYLLFENANPGSIWRGTSWESIPVPFQIEWGGTITLYLCKRIW